MKTMIRDEEIVEILESTTKNMRGVIMELQDIRKTLVNILEIQERIGKRQMILEDDMYGVKEELKKVKR